MASLSLRFSLLLTALLPLTLTSVGGVVLPRTPAEVYDYIVVGGGSAGSVVASRLSENRSVSVLLIEGGPSNEGVTNSIIPYVYPRLYGTTYDWNFTTVPQSGLNGRVTPYLRGHILGGSSSINGMTLHRAPAADWDQIASFTGDSSFSWNNIIQYIQKNEAFKRPEGSRFDNAYDPAVHGFKGPIGSSLVEDDIWITEPTLTAAEEIGIPHSRDVNGGQPLGASWQQFTVKDGARSSAATAYVNKQDKVRSNLHVLLNSKVSRVLPRPGSNTTSGPLHFTTVEYTDGNGNTQTAVASREIIISTGVIATPGLLMRSGLGPRAQLQAAGITTLLDIPAVGQYLQDRCSLSAIWSVNNTDTDDNIDRNLTYFNELLQEWNDHRTGRLTQTGYRHILWARVPEDAPILSTIEDPSSGPTCPHYEIYPTNKWAGTSPRPETGNFVTMSIFVSASNVRGSVTLDASNPMNPIIDPKYLGSDWDTYVMRTAVRRAAEYMNAPAWRRWNATPVFDPSILDNDDALDQWIQTNAVGGVHAVGSARMGPPNSPPGTDVVGPDFRVKGVRGLRIVDTSVFPFVMNAHTMGPTYIMAEKAADLIKTGL
ncbi:hypothetical protein H1R20_g14467, partial [Candolleomyces eurysporus]